MLSTTTSRLLTGLNQAQFGATQIMEELMAYDLENKRLNAEVKKLTVDKDLLDKESETLQSRVNELCERNTTLGANIKLLADANKQLQYQITCQADALNESRDSYYNV